MIKEIIKLYDNDYLLSKMTGVTPMTLYRIKTNKTNPSKKTIERLETYFQHTKSMIEMYFKNKELKKV